MYVHIKYITHKALFYQKKYDFSFFFFFFTNKTDFALEHHQTLLKRNLTTINIY